ncbi:MAG: DUF2202 domain-containing protein [Gammaproteobacteria bacterium]|nr:DUF2202 domain-containing protein [Gammaproteobacteria bacterium]
MRTIPLIATALIAIGLVASPLSAQAGKGPGAAGARPSPPSAVTLSDDEIETLQWMREEEKLARDIYIKMQPLYPDKAIFENIAASEQRHFDALGRKIALYGVNDPALPAIGAFTNPDLQALYNTLLTRGSQGYLEALEVGVEIEEGDIIDLERALDGTDVKPLVRTYEHLLNGSENHLSSFEKLL